jgi:hypothetical protein
MVVCGTDWTVRPNRWYNIRQYTSRTDGLNICWVYNYLATDWERLLPYPTRRLLHPEAKHAPSGANTFADFPWYRTFFEDKLPLRAIQLSAPQVNMLADLATWMITEPATQTKIEQALNLQGPIQPPPKCAAALGSHGQ